MNVSRPNSSSKQQQLMRQEMHGHVHQRPAVRYGLHIHVLHRSQNAIYAGFAPSVQMLTKDEGENEVNRQNCKQRHLCIDLA